MTETRVTRFKDLHDRRPVGFILDFRSREKQVGAKFLAASITFFSFLALFPLILLVMSVTGFVIAAEPEVQLEWAARISSIVPGLEDLVSSNLEQLAEGRAATGIVGLLGLVWVGLRVIDSTRFTLSRVFERERARSALLRKTKDFGSFVALGILGIFTTALASLIGGTLDTNDETLAMKAVGLGIGIVLDFAFFIVAYRVLTPGPGPTWRDLWAGALLAAGAWMVLKLLGSWFAARTVANSTEVYGSFAVVLGILALLYLSVRIFVYGGLVNAVLIRRRSA